MHLQNKKFKQWTGNDTIAQKVKDKIATVEPEFVPETGYDGPLFSDIRREQSKSSLAYFRLVNFCTTLQSLG